MFVLYSTVLAMYKITNYQGSYYVYIQGRPNYLLLQWQKFKNNLLYDFEDKCIYKSEYVIWNNTACVYKVKYVWPPVVYILYIDYK